MPHTTNTEAIEAADILNRAADHIQQHGLDPDRHVIAAIAIAAYGNPTAPIASRGGAPERARTHLFWHLRAEGAFLAESLLPTAEATVRALREAADSIR